MDDRPDSSKTAAGAFFIALTKAYHVFEATEDEEIAEGLGEAADEGTNSEAVPPEG